MSYVAIFESTLEKLTDAEKENLQASLDSYYVEGYDKGLEDGREEGYSVGRDNGYIMGYDAGVDNANLQ